MRAEQEPHEPPAAQRHGSRCTRQLGQRLHLEGRGGRVGVAQREKRLAAALRALALGQERTGHVEKLGGEGTDLEARHDRTP